MSQSHQRLRTILFSFEAMACTALGLIPTFRATAAHLAGLGKLTLIPIMLLRSTRGNLTPL